jgi:hypothetical protein
VNTVMKLLAGGFRTAEQLSIFWKILSWLAVINNTNNTYVYIYLFIRVLTHSRDLVTSKIRP